MGRSPSSVEWRAKSFGFAEMKASTAAFAASYRRL